MSDEGYFDALAQMTGDKLEWECLLLKFESGPPVAPGTRIPDEYVPGDPLGPVESVRAAITEILPGVEWRYPDRGYLSVGRLEFTFNVHLDSTCDNVMLLVAGDGDPFSTIVMLCRVQSWTPIDLTTWQVLDLDSPSREGWNHVKKAVERNRGKKFSGWR